MNFVLAGQIKGDRPLKTISAEDYADKHMTHVGGAALRSSFQMERLCHDRLKQEKNNEVRQCS